MTIPAPVPIDPELFLLNRAEAESISAQNNAEFLALVHELINYGTQLLKISWENGTKTLPEGCLDVVIVSGLFRAFLSHLDGFSSLVKSGNGYSARLQLRTLVEGVTTLHWILKEDSDNRARHLYVADVREQRAWLEAAVPEIEGGKKEKLKGLPLTELKDEHIEDCRAKIAVFNKILKHPLLAPIDKAFSEAKPDAKWHKLCGANTFRDIANAVDMTGEYVTLYSAYSQTQHGTDLSHNFDIGKHNVAFPFPLRQLIGSGDALSYSITASFSAFYAMIKRYVPKESVRFHDLYENRWKAIFMKVTEPKLLKS